MGDFTKEELESIWRWADAHSDKEWYKNLSEKIKSMIDNYCELNSSCNVQGILDFAKGRYDDLLFILGDRGKGYFLPHEKEQSFEMLIAKLHELHTIISIAKALIEDDQISRCS